MHTGKIGADQAPATDRVACEASSLKNLLAGLLCPAILRMSNGNANSESPHEQGSFALEKNANHLLPACRFVGNGNRTYLPESLRLCDLLGIRIIRYRCFAIRAEDMERILRSFRSGLVLRQGDIDGFKY